MSFELKLKQVYESAGKDQTLKCLSDAIAEKKFNPASQWSLRRLFETFHGYDWAEKFQTKSILEGPEAVSLSNAAAVGVTGQLLLSIIKDAYELQTTVADQLCTEIGVSNQNLGEEVTAYVSSPSNVGQIVQEGQPFPAATLATQSVTLPPILKWGETMNLTYEAIAGDKTSQIVRQANMIGEMVKLSKTYNIIQTVLGYLSTYKFNGTNYSTYYTSTDANIFTNKITSFSIDSLASINQLEQLVRNQVDPYSGQPIELLNGPKDVLVVPAALYKVRSIINGDSVRYGNYNASTDRFATFAANPLASGEYNILSDIYVRNVLINNVGQTAANTENTMLLGNFKKAFMYRVFRPLELTVLPQPSQYNFTNDVMFSCRAVHMGSCGVMEPRAVALGVVS